jgi:hypothetical protein
MFVVYGTRQRKAGSWARFIAEKLSLWLKYETFASPYKETTDFMEWSSYKIVTHLVKKCSSFMEPDREEPTSGSWARITAVYCTPCCLSQGKGKTIHAHMEINENATKKQTQIRNCII